MDDANVVIFVLYAGMGVIFLRKKGWTLSVVVGWGFVECPVCMEGRGGSWLICLNVAFP